MGAAADDLLRDDDEREAVRRVRERKAVEKKEADEKEAHWGEARAAFSRLKSVVTGEEKPTRESIEQYRKRKGI